MRTGAQTGLAFETENMAPVLQACLDAAGESFPSSLTVVGCGEELDDLFEGSAIQNKLTALCAEKSIELFFRQSDEDCSVLLAQGFDEGNAINLLQGAYSRKEQVGKMLRPWRTALILGAVWLVLQAGSFITDYNRLSSLADEQQAEIEAVFSKIFDDLVAHVVPFIVQFQQVGEGLGETKDGVGRSGLDCLEHGGIAFLDLPGNPSSRLG